MTKVSKNERKEGGENSRVVWFRGSGTEEKTRQSWRK